MKAIGHNYIDYWQCFYPAQRGLKNRFGVRVGDGRCWAVIQIGDGEASTFGKPHEIPVDLAILPIYLRAIVDNQLLNYPSTDLVDVLAGKKSFREALDCPSGIGVKRATANLPIQLADAS